jgi:hypothetical protein
MTQGQCIRSPWYVVFMYFVLKEVLYKRTQIHLYNNQFKEAMLINGFWPRDPSELNWVFHIQASSPAIRTQADLYR